MNPPLAELLQKALVTVGQENRDPMYKEADQMLHDDVARIWMFHTQLPLIFSTKVAGYVTQVVDADNYQDVTVSP
jgi:ABC-type transport system substrate-binding protein